MLPRSLGNVTVAAISRVFLQQTKPCQAGRLQRYLSRTRREEPTEIEEEAESSTGERVILLHNEEGRVLGSRSLRFALELAEKRNMGLVKLDSGNLKKDWYKLVPLQDFIQESFDDAPEEGSSRKRSEIKKIHIGAKIAEQDLKTKAKSVSKWISQNLEVRVMISGDPSAGKGQLTSVLEQLRGFLEGTPHTCTESKPVGGVLKVSLRASNEEKPEKSGKK